ncbi:methyltransferase domain-containing protein, partial [Candidatus Woesearchaeota archaeon]|nr:methyltransferase domain-containing protein [Candidatus Woesearchaeota archaeon]
MAKILIRKQKKEYIPELEKEVITIQALKYYVTDLNKDFHTKYGIIFKKDLNLEDGTVIKSNTGKEFVIFTAQFSDKFKKLKRAPQTIIQKDIGAIIAETGLGKNDEVLDAGTGAGALACALANICHKVYSYETRKEHLEVARQNIKTLNINNIILRNRDITKEVQEKNINLATLDIPEPWKA